MTRNRKKVVVFDFDGTIVNSMEAFADTASEVMPKYFPIDEKTARRRYIETSGLPFFEQLEVMFPGNSSNAAAAEEFEQKKLKGYFSRPLFKDVYETLDLLKKKGIKVVVSSNNFQDLVDKFVGQTGIVFDLALGYKPNFAKGADHFNYIIEKTGCAREEMAFVGDSLRDGERAKSFGVDFIGKEGIFTGAEFEAKFPQAKVISTLTELKEIL